MPSNHQLLVAVALICLCYLAFNFLIKLGSIKKEPNPGSASQTACYISPVLHKAHAFGILQKANLYQKGLHTPFTVGRDTS